MLFGLWHRFVLPRPAADRPGDVRDVPRFVREFLGTFGSFFRKPRIAALLLFLLLYRFGEAQLVKMTAPFLLDARAAGGLGAHHHRGRLHQGHRRGGRAGRWAASSAAGWCRGTGSRPGCGRCC